MKTDMFPETDLAPCRLPRHADVSWPGQPVAGRLAAGLLTSSLAVGSLAVGSLVYGLIPDLSATLAAIVLACRHAARSSRSGQDGAALAVAGLALGAFWLLLTSLALIIYRSRSSVATRDQSRDQESVPAQDLAVRDEEPSVVTRRPPEPRGGQPLQVLPGGEAKLDGSVRDLRSGDPLRPQPAPP